MPVFAERKMLRFALTLHRFAEAQARHLCSETTGQRFDGKEPASPAFCVVIFLSTIGKGPELVQALLAP